MGGTLKRLALSALAASLFWGGALVAQGFPQEARVAYALTLIDAGSDPAAPNNSQSGTPVTDATRYVRVKVTVSVPRAEGAGHAGVVVNASPTRLMCRAHRGPSTAFGHAIVLVRDAPYSDAAGTPMSGAYYPMPQANGTASQQDPTALNYLGVSARATVNAEGTAYETYTALGRAHDPMRWESTYLSQEVYDLQDANFATRYPMIDSLLRGEGTYEWYATPRYGLGSFTRISDIQDLGRKQDCTDVRLWEGVASTQATADLATLSASARASLGQSLEMRLRAMPETATDSRSWHIYRGSIGVNSTGLAGAQLLNLLGGDADYADYARLESPWFPDGIGEVSFEAMVSYAGDEEQQLLVQRRVDDGFSAWEDVQRVTLSGAFRTYTVDFGAEANARSAFRLVRTTRQAVGGDAHLTTLVVRKIRVRSAKPQASFPKPLIAPRYPAYTQGDPFEVTYRVTPGTGTAVRPRGYEVELKVKRRAQGDLTREAYALPMSITFNEGDGSAVLSGSIARQTLVTNSDGSTNVKENAFFTDVDGSTLTGLLPGVYDLGLDYRIFGSFLAGREVIDERESVAGYAETYEVAVTDEDGNEIGTKTYPVTLDYREQITHEAQVFLRATYLSGAGTSALPYEVKTLDLPLLPSAKEPDTWRVDVARVLRLAADSTAVYAWGEDDGDPATEPTYTEGYFSFIVGVTNSDGTYWFGQKQPAASGVMPSVISPLPATTEALALAASEAAAVPLPVALAALPNSHLMVELRLPADVASGDDAQAQIGGSYWQDFNAWYAPSENFTETDFRDDCQSVTADFDCTLTETSSGERMVARGWYPDEGPLAQESSFTETFETDSGSSTGLVYHMPSVSDMAMNNFVQWGASSLTAEPRYLRADSSSSQYNSRYMTLSDTAEVVLSRAYSRGASGKYQPDSLLRLRGTGSSISPQEGDANAEVVLNGVGSVRFTMGLSIPYNYDYRARLIGKDGASMFEHAGAGISAGVSFNEPSKTCAPSGYSVSYYLEDFFDNKAFELRITQMTRFNETSETTEPTGMVVAELYQWSGNSPTRLTLASDAEGSIPLAGGYKVLPAPISQKSYGLWVLPNGRLAVGVGTSLTATSLTVQCYSKDAVAQASTAYLPALGSAECRPIFRQIQRMGAAATAYTGSPIALATVSKWEPSAPTWAGTAGSWTLAQDAGSNAHIQLTRRSPPASEAGQLKVIARRNGEDVATKYVETGDTNAVCSATLGVTGATLILAPAGPEHNLFLDNIYVTSWCGNDKLRNGSNYVPRYTNAGFFSGNGFAAVGVWIRPEEDAQLSVAPADYNGSQCVLLQRSRKNTDGLTGEISTGGILHTGDSLAIYMPYSESGFGSVSFRYRIPSFDEYGSGLENPTVRVMLQYLADATAYNNFLGNEARSGWVNVSDPVELRNTAGAWAMTSILPKFTDEVRAGQELTGVKGTLRLVMVTSGYEDGVDPYVYLDDLRVNDNATGTLASWSALNVKLTSTPVSQLYWKDRTAATADPPEETFAQKSVLTQALQFNNGRSGTDVDGTFDTTLLNTPLLENGVGRVSFAARLAEASTEPVRLYLWATTSREDAALATFQPVTYVEVTNTVYTVYDVDLSKYTRYKTIPNPDLSPSDNASGTDFAAKDVRRLRLQAYLQEDVGTSDGFGGAGADRTITAGRILIDQVAISDPILPSLDIESVAFSNVSGTNSAAEFDRSSPLSQPVANAPALRTMVTLSHAQLLVDDSIRVFITLNPERLGASANLTTYTSGYTYTTALGTSSVFSASDSNPVYAWNTANLAEWPLSKWFDLADASSKVRAHAPTAPATVLTIEELAGFGLANTVELERAPGTYNFFGDLTALNLNDLPVNSLVRYTAWAVYKSADSDAWFATQISPKSYTDFPWYFPRSLNSEIAAKAAENNVEGEMFSPYYWVYSCIPGEVFINEFNLNDASDVSYGMGPFVELCAPAGLDIGAWRVCATGMSSLNLVNLVGFTVPTATGGTLLPLPDAGAVPAQRKMDTNSARAFYTSAVLARDMPVYYREGNIIGGEHVVDFTVAGGTDMTRTANGGIFARNFDDDAVGSLGTKSGEAASLLLLRPTGGAEHIVCFGDKLSVASSTDAASLRIDRLYEAYRTAMVAGGFGGEWYQTFMDGDWDTYGTGSADGFGAMRIGDEPGLTLKQAHGRRLTKANFFPSAGASTNHRFDQSATTFSVANDFYSVPYATSLATVDMGGVWVARRNAIDTDAENGPLDLTSLCYAWPAGRNPVVTPRPVDLPSDSGLNAPAPSTQVTPRQINPNQYLVRYRELSQSTVYSQLEGVKFGTHMLDIFDAEGDATASESRRAGRNTPTTWSIPATSAKVQLNYQALPFHKVSAVSLRLVEAKTGDVALAQDVIAAQLIGGTTAIAEGPDAQGWVKLDLAGVSRDFFVQIKLKMASSADEDDRYNVEAKATFALDETSHFGDVITKVRPYCGTTLGSSAPYQPWWGSGFGFEVLYDEGQADGARLTSFVVTYPSPSGLSDGYDAWAGLDAPWAGLSLGYDADTDGDGTDEHHTLSLQGLEYAEALTALGGPFSQYGKARFVELKDLSAGRAVSASAVDILSDTYATALGYVEGSSTTWSRKEPAIPFCVWGVYAYTIASDTGGETVSWLMPQAALEDKPGLFDYPAWYAPLPDRNEGHTRRAPYFYLYSTPPQSAWLNEVNLVQGPAAGTAPYAEVVMPYLRAGILNAKTPVPQTTNHGWRVARYDETGTERASAPVTPQADPANPVTRLSYAYSYNTVTGFETVASADLSAYVLHRPCGAAEGGVWSQATATGGAEVSAPTLAHWLTEPSAYVVAGKSDSTTEAGSVQLAGQLTYIDGMGYLSSDVSLRTDWVFANETPAAHNAGASALPDIDPEWNRVTISSTMRNTVYGGVLCGYQQFGFMESDAISGQASNAGALTQSLSGTAWVYDAASNQRLVLTYRPRSNYRYERLVLPQSLIGHVMLIGQDRALTQAEVDAEVARLRTLAAADDNARYTDWIQMGMGAPSAADVNGRFRATVEYREELDELGATVRVPTGAILFNPDYVASSPTAPEVVTFGDQDNFVLTIVFADEPASSLNAIQMEMGQGSVRAGAWLVTQSFYALNDDLSPNEAKGGSTVTKPIWSDEDGNIDGDYRNLHGWLHQPQVGDRLGMSAVINPELGLVGGDLGATAEVVREALAQNTALRPFLVWTLIPKSKVPTNLFADGTGDATKRREFLANWDLAAAGWFGASPSVVGGAETLTLDALRQKLYATVNSAAGFYRAAGIIPMTYQGFCAQDRTLESDPTQARAEDTLLAYRTMTADELAAAEADSATTGLTGGTGLLPYTSMIEMRNGADSTLWEDGAVLRFAIVVADPFNRIYEVQSVSNFTSEEQDAYCPWYIPEAKANINVATTAEDAGVSPYAWVYAIARGGVWINEFRPFSPKLAEGERDPTKVTSAFELAMFASPYAYDATLDRYIPEYSLDGWKVVFKYAPLPQLGTPAETPLVWTEDHSVELKSWVPYHRFEPNGDTTANPEFYVLDYYLAAETIDNSIGNNVNGDLSRYPYELAAADIFKWLPLDEPIFDSKLEDDLRTRAIYENGVVYAIALVRNNGVVEDEVLFYYRQDGLSSDQMPERLQLAIDSENANRVVASEVRGLPWRAVKEVLAAEPNNTLRFYEYTGDGSLLWDVDASGSALNTLPGANISNLIGLYVQPRAAYALPTITSATLSARLLGGDASLTLTLAGTQLLSGRSLTASTLRGTRYDLALSPWNSAWYTLASVTRNGQRVEPPAQSTVSVLSADGSTLSSTRSITFANESLTEDTDYAFTFTYTPQAALLASTGALNAQDDGFLAWLLSVDPDAIREQTERDGVTASEKYWLGLDNALVSAEQVDLAITSLGTYTEEGGEPMPTLSIALKNGEEPIGELRGDGVLILLGKQRLSDEWQYVRRLYPEDVSGESHLILRTDCTFFKAILLSAAEAPVEQN